MNGPEPADMPARKPRSARRRAEIGLPADDAPMEWTYTPVLGNEAFKALKEEPPPRRLALPRLKNRETQADTREWTYTAAFEDTSTLLDAPEHKTFFSRQPPLFWIAGVLSMVALFIVVAVIGVNAWQELEAGRAEARRIQQLEEEKKKYKLLYRDDIETNAAEQGVDPALVAAVIYNESRFEPSAESYLGARGLMQIMEETGGWIAGKLDETATYTFDAMYDPQTNIRYGVWYLGFLSRLFDGDIVKIAAGYHAGQGRVDQWLDNPEYSTDGTKLEVIPFDDTKQYVSRVVSAYEMYTKHYYPKEETAPENGAS